MIAKFARLRGIDRARNAIPGAAARPCNDNYRTRSLVAPASRARRPVLVCQWRKALLTGALECVWGVEEATGKATSEEPKIRTIIGSSRDDTAWRSSRRAA